MPDPAAPATPVPANTGPANPVPANTTLDYPGLANPALDGTVLDGTVLATVVDTPIGPLSLLARDGRLIAGGFTADPAGMHARLDPELRALPLRPPGPRRPPGSWRPPTRVTCPG